MKARNMLHAFLLVLLVLPFGAQAAEQAGTLLMAFGDVKATDADGNTRALQRRGAVYAGDTLVTGRRGSAQVRFTDGSIMAFKANTTFRIDEYRYKSAAGEDTSFYSLIVGGFRALSGAIGKTDSTAYQVKTPVATIGIRGTLWEGNYDEENGLGLGVWNGGIKACNSGGCTDFGQGADHNFGTVTSDDEEPQGQDEPPPGIGGEGGNDAGAGNGEEDQESGDDLIGDGDTGPDRLLQDLFDQGLQGEHVVAPTYDTSDWRFQGAYFVGLGDGNVPAFLAGQGDGDVSVDPMYFDVYTDLASWRFYSPDTGNGDVLIDYADPNNCDCSISGTALNGDKNAVVIWGDWWNATHQATFDPLNNTTAEPLTGSGGQFIMGDVSPLAVVQGMSGTVTYDSVVVLEGQDSVGGWPDMAYSMATFQVNFDSGNVNAQMSLTDISYNSWNLDMTGKVVDSGMQLVLQNSSSYSNIGLFGSTVPITGDVGGTFIGTKGIQGIIGAYKLQTTVDNPNTNKPVHAHGIFAITEGGMIGP